MFRGLSMTDLKNIYHLVSVRTMKPGDIFIRAGCERKHIAYIRKGLIRSFLINDKGDEITTMLRWEDQFVASHDNVVWNRPSRFDFEALEPTELIQMDYDKLQQVLRSNPAYEQVRKHFLLKVIGESLERVESFILLNPEERYLKLIEQKPEIVNRVQDKYIAHILGITPVSLSRIRRRIAESRK